MINNVTIPEKSDSGFVIRNIHNITGLYEKIPSTPYRLRECSFRTFEIARLVRRNFYRMFSKYSWRLHNASAWNGQENERWLIGRSLQSLSSECSALTYAAGFYPAVEKTVYDSATFAVMSPEADELLDLMEQADRALYRIKCGESDPQEVEERFRPVRRAYELLHQHMVYRDVSIHSRPHPTTDSAPTDRSRADYLFLK